MNKAEQFQWWALVDAADAYALSVYVGPVDHAAETRFDATLVLAGKPGGLVGRQVFLADLSSRHDEPEWKAARLAASTRCLVRAGEIRDAVHGLVEQACATPELANAVATTVLSAAAELGGRGGLDGTVLREFLRAGIHGSPESVRLIARRCLGNLTADLETAARAFDNGLLAEDELAVAVAMATEGLTALARVAQDDLDRSEVRDVLETNVVAAVAHGDCTRLTILIRLQAQLLGWPFRADVQEAIDVCFVARDAHRVAAFRSLLGRG